jgi:hypothetical protein
MTSPKEKEEDEIVVLDRKIKKTESLRSFLFYLSD